MTLTINESTSVTCWVIHNERLKKATKFYLTDVDEYMSLRGKRQSNSNGDSPFSKEQYLSHTLEVCQKIYNDSYIKPLKKLCSMQPEIRRKRIVPVVIGGALLIGGIIFASASNAYMISRMQDKVTDFERKIESRFADADKLIEKVIDSHIELQSAVQTNQKHIQSVASELHKLKANMDVLFRLVPSVMAEKAIITTSLMSSGKDFEEAARIWKSSSVISPRFFEGLKITELCEGYGYCPIETIRQFYCSLEEKEDYHNLTASFITSLMDENRKVVEAKPFSIYQINSTHVCKTQYIGHQFFMLDKNSSKVCELLPAEVEGNNIPLPPDGPCDQSIPNNSTLVWKVSDCKPVNESFPIERDVRWINGAYHIQCFGNNITYNGVTQPCPPYVFRMGANNKFSIGNRTHLYYRTNVLRTIGVVEEWTSLIEVRMPEIPPYRPLDMPAVKSFELPSRIYQYVEKHVKINKNNVFFWIGLTISFLTLIILFYVYFNKIRIRVTKPSVSYVAYRPRQRKPYIVSIVTKKERPPEIEPFSLIDLDRR